MSGQGRATRTFKTAWFSKAARKARLTDAALCEAIRQVRLGQADDLGGGVFKKRLDKNRARSIILATSGRLWIYEYLFAKKDRANITTGELEDFRALAKGYAALTDAALDRLLRDEDLVEICHDTDEPLQQ